MHQNEYDDLIVYFGPFSLPIHYISNTIFPFATLAYFLVIYKIYTNNKGDWKTSHVFLINLISTFSLSMIWILIEALIGEENKQGEICYRQFVSLLFRIYINSDIFILQIDRFVSVWKPYLHRSVATPKLAVKIVLVSKVPSTLAAIIGVLIYPSYLSCSYCTVCRITHSVSIALVSYSSIASTILTIIVSIFITATLVKLNKVDPIPRPFPFVINVSQTNLSQRQSEHQEADVTVEDLIATMYKQQPSPAVEYRNKEKHKTLKQSLTMNLLTLFFLLHLPIELLVVQSKSCTMGVSDCRIFLQKIAPLFLLSIFVFLAHPLLLLRFLKKK